MSRYNFKKRKEKKDCFLVYEIVSVQVCTIVVFVSISHNTSIHGPSKQVEDNAASSPTSSTAADS